MELTHMLCFDQKGKQSAFVIEVEKESFEGIDKTLLAKIGQMNINS